MPNSPLVLTLSRTLTPPNGQWPYFIFLQFFLSSLACRTHLHKCGLTFVHKNITSALPFWQACPGSSFKFAGFSAACVTSSFNDLSQSVGWTHVVQCTQRERERERDGTNRRTRDQVRRRSLNKEKLYETKFIGTFITTYHVQSICSSGAKKL